LKSHVREKTGACSDNLLDLESIGMGHSRTCRDVWSVICGVYHVGWINTIGLEILSTRVSAAKILLRGRVLAVTVAEKSKVEDFPQSE
jgi:hypothetical protein